MLTEKLARLEALLRQYRSTVVCFSGGLDSAFVLAAATRALGSEALGLTAVSPSLPAREREDAARIARALGARHETIESGELARDEYARNGPDRCFHCKSELYELAERVRRKRGFAVVVNGTNLDDLGDYRPGLEAAKNAGARSPLVEAGFTKAEVRDAARLWNLDVWDKPAAACLSSRIPYGVRVTRERLAQVESVEAALADAGFRHARVRWHDEIARIELAPEDFPRALELRASLSAAARSAGFRYVTLDLDGYRTGSLNEALPSRRLPVMNS